MPIGWGGKAGGFLASREGGLNFFNCGSDLPDPVLPVINGHSHRVSSVRQMILFSTNTMIGFDYSNRHQSNNRITGGGGQNLCTCRYTPGYQKLIHLLGTRKLLETPMNGGS